jgi:hypothetical protein
VGNSAGNYRTTTKNKMAAYDKLPPSARAALAAANFSWAPQPLLTGFEKRGHWKTGKELAAYIVKIDEVETGKSVHRTYGPDHPQAVRPARKTRSRKS